MGWSSTYSGGSPRARLSARSTVCPAVKTGNVEDNIPQYAGPDVHCGSARVVLKDLKRSSLPSRHFSRAFKSCLTTPATTMAQEVRLLPRQSHPSVPETSNNIDGNLSGQPTADQPHQLPQNPSFVLQKPGSVVFENRPIPTLTSDFDVLVEPKYTGICGSDVHYWVHGSIGPFVVKEPMVLGHESSGIISAVGARVTTLKVGDRVCMEPGVCCRRCARCKEGNYNLCFDMKFAATPPYDGTLARYYVLPEDFCYKLPEHVSLEEGALMEPLSVGVHVVRQGGVQSGDSVV
nr:putative d-xylulose reductase a [Quercus suber]